MWHAGKRREMHEGSGLENPDRNNPLVGTKCKWDDNITTDLGNKLLGCRPHLPGSKRDQLLIYINVYYDY
jgi:hypothetical protein